MPAMWPKSPREVKAAALAEHFGLRRIHVLVLMAAVLAQALMAPMQGIMNLMLDSIQAEFGVSDSKISFCATLTLGSSALGGLLFGRLYDVVGRRKGLIISAASAMILSLAHFVVPYGTERGFYMLLALRFCYGLPYGGLNVMSILYPSELFPNYARGMAVALGSVGWSLCFFYMTPFVPMYTTNAPWRSILAFLPWGPGLLMLAVCSLIPESPRWLLSDGQDAQESLRAIFASQPLYGTTPAGVGDAPTVDVSDMARNPSYGLASARTIDTIKMMFSPKLLYTTVIASLLYATMCGTCHAITTWGPLIVKEAAGQEPRINIFLYAEGLGTVALILVALMADRVSRRTLISIAFMLMACVFAMLLRDPGTNGSHTPFALWFVFELLYCGVWPVVALSVTEAFPTTLRGAGTGFAFAWGRVAASVCPTLAGLFVRHSYKYLLVAAILGCMLKVLLAILMPVDRSAAAMDDVVASTEPTVDDDTATA